jgi:hypothetical protein
MDVDRGSVYSYDAHVQHFEDESLGLMSLPFGNALPQHGATCAGREGRPVKQFKDLNACIAELQALCVGSDIRPEQKKNVEAAIEQLRRLRRKPDAKMTDVYLSVREIADRLIAAFFR